MRRALIAVLPALASVGALLAGPAMAQYDGPFLRWPGKTQPAEPAQPAVQPPAPQPEPQFQPEAVAPRTAPQPQPQPQPQAMAAPVAAPAISAPVPIPPLAAATPAMNVAAPPHAVVAFARPQPPQVAPAGARMATVTPEHMRTRVRLEAGPPVTLAAKAPPPAASQIAKATPPAVQPAQVAKGPPVEPARRVAKLKKTPPATPTAQTQQAAAEPAPQHSQLPPHFYSVARQYGVTPDPIPLPAQFFNNPPDADMAQPPPPLEPHAVPGAQTVNSTATANTPANRARAIALDTQSPDGGD
jgi:hypothetical protein